MRLRQALAVGGSIILMLASTTPVWAVGTEDTVTPTWNDSSIADKYTITDTGDGVVQLSSGVRSGYETFTVDGVELNEVSITSTGNTIVQARVYDVKSNLIKTYEITIKIPARQIGTKTQVDTKLITGNRTVALEDKSVPIEMEITAIADPAQLTLNFGNDGVEFSEKSKKTENDKLLLSGELKGTKSTGQFKLTISETVAGKSYTSSILFKTTAKVTGESSSGGGDDDKDETMKISLSSDKLEITARETGQIFIGFTPKITYSQWLEDGYSVRISSSAVKAELNRFESKEDPYEACLQITAGNTPSENYLTATLFKDGEELDSKLLKVKVKASTDVAETLTGSSSVEVTPQEQLLTGMEASSGVIAALDALGPNEALNYDSTTSWRIGTNALLHLQKVSARIVMNNPKLRCSLSFGGRDILNVEPLRSIDFGIYTDKTLIDNVQSKLDTLGYDGAMDAYSFKFDPDQVSPTAELYTFVRDDKTAYVYDFNELSREFSPLNTQTVWGGKISTKVGTSGTVVILEQNLAELQYAYKPEGQSTSTSDNSPTDETQLDPSDDSEISDTQTTTSPTTAKPEKKPNWIIPLLIAVAMGTGVFTIIFTIFRRSK